MKKRIFAISVQYIGKREKASKYLYEIWFYQSCNLKYSFGGYCLPYMDTSKEMMSHPNVFKFDLDNIFFKEIPSEICFHITIRFPH